MQDDEEKMERGGEETEEKTATTTTATTRAVFCGMFTGSPVYYHDVEQGSDEWKALRCCLTASRAAAWFGMRPYNATKGDVVLDVLGLAPPFTTKANGFMAWGSAAESTAADSYEDRYLEKLHVRGFYSCPALGIGASPDRVVLDEEDGSIRKVVEIKCPATYRWRGPIQEPHFAHIEQARMQAFLTGAREADIFYWAPRANWTRNFHIEVLDPVDYLLMHDGDFRDFRETIALAHLENKKKK